MALSGPPSGLSYTLTSTMLRPAATIHALASKELRPRHCGLPLIDHLRDLIVLHGGLYGFRTLEGILQEAAPAEDDGLARDDLLAALRRLGLTPSDFEMHTLMRHFGSDVDALLGRRQFITGISCKLNDFRRHLLVDLYGLLRHVCGGPVTVQGLADLFDAAEHPLVQAGRVTAEAAQRDMVAAWHRPLGHVISQDEFLEYWGDVSAAVDDDEWFELSIRNPWHLAGGKGVSQNTTCRPVEVRHADGRTTREVVTNDLGLGPADTPGLLTRLKEQGVTDAKGLRPL
eukprot:EG_transcript_22495